jgi:hypothetical protein
VLARCPDPSRAIAVPPPPPPPPSTVTHFTFWVKAEPGINFAIAVKSQSATSPETFTETDPKVTFTERQSATGTASCVCGTHGAWRKVCIPLTELLPANPPGTQVDLTHLVTATFAFAAYPFVTVHHERGVGEITVDELAFEAMEVSR